MEQIIIYRVIITLLVMILGILAILCNFYRCKRYSYKEKFDTLAHKNTADKNYSKIKEEELRAEIHILKSTIKRLSFILKGKPAILAKDKLRFTFSVRANGKRVARIKPIGETNKGTSVMGESMVQISKDVYIKESTLHDILRVSIGNDNKRYLSIENQIDTARQYNI